MMQKSSASAKPELTNDQIRDEWLSRLGKLVDQVQRWANELDWSTRRIEKQMRDPQLGSYAAPALLLQHETTRMLLEPITWSSPGADGVVDLYLMPAYDDIATLYFSEGQWHLHYMSPAAADVSTIRDANSLPVTKDALDDVLQVMKAHAATI